MQPKQGYCTINEKEITGSNKPKVNEIVGKIKFNVNNVSYNGVVSNSESSGVSEWMTISVHGRGCCYAAGWLGNTQASKHPNLLVAGYESN